jgi:hypothetical protein
MDAAAFDVAAGEVSLVVEPDGPDRVGRLERVGVPDGPVLVPGGPVVVRVGVMGGIGRIEKDPLVVLFEAGQSVEGTCEKND